jgi:DNA polymerase elongation subunit (family B)
MIGSSLGYIDRTRPGIAGNVLTTLITKRKMLPDKRSPLGWAYKIAANSYYGTLGSKMSSMSCNFAAATVTALGRYITKFTIEFLRSNNLQVIYGDTDSVFVKFPSKRSTKHITKILDKFHSILKGTIFEKLELELDVVYDSMIMVAKKMYVGNYTKDNKILQKVKGLATIRRDRPMICRTALKDVISIICVHGPTKSQALVEDYIYDTVYDITNKKIPLSKVMIETKENAALVWAYQNDIGKRVTIDKSIDLDRYSNYPDTTWVINYLRNTLKRILDVCNLPLFDKCITNSDRRRSGI